MTDAINAKMTWDTAESKYREAFVGVVWLNHIAHIPERTLILVVLSEVVKRTLRARVTVGGRIVDSGDQRYCPTGSQVVNESGPCVDLEVAYDTSSVLIALQSRATSFKIVESCHH